MNWFYRVNGQVITRVVSRRVCVCIGVYEGHQLSFLHPPKNLSDIQFFHPPAIPFTLPTLKEQTWQ
jgi:hypothetical protein